MAIFSIPVMPLEVAIWRFDHSPFDDFDPDVVTVGNLAWGKRTFSPSTGGTGSIGTPLVFMTLLLPKLTDVRGDIYLIEADFLEVPLASGRFYQCIFVDDLGKGFTNEHRGALLVQLPAHWPYPTP